MYELIFGAFFSLAIWMEKQKKEEILITKVNQGS